MEANCTEIMRPFNVCADASSDIIVTLTWVPEKITVAPSRYRRIGSAGSESLTLTGSESLTLTGTRLTQPGAAGL